MVCANTPWEWGKHSKTEACMAAMQRARESAAWGELERWARDGSQGACVPHWKFDLYPECNKSQWRVSNRDGGRHYLILVIERSLRMFLWNKHERCKELAGGDGWGSVTQEGNDGLLDERLWWVWKQVHGFGVPEEVKSRGPGTGKRDEWGVVYIGKTKVLQPGSK